MNTKSSRKVIRLVFVGNKLYDVVFVPGNYKQSIPNYIIGMDCSTGLPCFQYSITKEHGNAIFLQIKKSRRQARNGQVFYCLNESFIQELVHQSKQILDAGVCYQ